MNYTGIYVIDGRLTVALIFIRVPFELVTIRPLLMEVVDMILERLQHIDVRVAARIAIANSNRLLAHGNHFLRVETECRSNTTCLVTCIVDITIQFQSPVVEVDPSIRFDVRTGMLQHMLFVFIAR